MFVFSFSPPTLTSVAKVSRSRPGSRYHSIAQSVTLAITERSWQICDPVRRTTITCRCRQTEVSWSILSGSGTAARPQRSQRWQNDITRQCNWTTKYSIKNVKAKLISSYLSSSTRQWIDGTRWIGRQLTRLAWMLLKQSCLGLRDNRVGSMK